MGRNKNKGRYRVLALVILVLSGAAAAIWWKAYLKAAKADNPKKDSEEKKHG